MKVPVPQPARVVFRWLATMTWVVVGLWVLGRIGGQIGDQPVPAPEFWLLLYLLGILIVTVWLLNERASE